MRRCLLVGVALVLALAACTGPGGPPAAAPATGTRGAAPSLAAAATPAAAPATPAAADCPVTRPPAPALTPPAEVGETRAGAGQFWYGNDALWVVLPADSVLWNTKFGWWRVARGQLSITGRRLDGLAPPFDAEIPSGYGDAGFQVSGLDFPTPGCWEVAGSVAGRALRFVAQVYPRAYWPPDASCGDLADTVRNSDLIVVATVEGELADRPGFAWRTVRVTRALAWRGATPQGDRLDVLQWTDIEPPLERGRTYVLFLRSRDGTPWRIVCPGLTLAEVSGDHVASLNAQVKPLWTGDTLDELAAQVATLAAPPGGTPTP